ncbi:hypothetical protein [Desulfovibrio cuneatus]|uniref:hypothetical protein n=1 Tax=Desulfovibrio cuneatus TaxID=159728 RepID=UPI0012EC6033|nr:hypothetical protein [Desulfovibrio cuneatus]
MTCAAQPEAQAPQATVEELQPAPHNATLLGTVANATQPDTISNTTLPDTAGNAPLAGTAGNATATVPGPSAMEEGPAVQPSATSAKNAASFKKNATSRAHSPASSTPARPAGKSTTKPATNNTAQQSAAAKRTTTPKQPAQGGNATQEKKHNTQNGTLGATGEKDGWIVIEQGTRPVYAGIHGGTVPLTVLRASNGALFALAGETGSDFMNVLRGNTTGTGRGAAAQQEEEKTAEQPNREASQPPQPSVPETATQQAAAPPQSQAESAQPESAHQEQTATGNPGKEQNATIQAEALQQPVAPVATANSTAPAAGKPVPSEPLAPAANASANAPMAEAAPPAPPAGKPPLANATTPQEEAKKPPKDPMVAKLLGIPPPEADLVIASSDLAHRLKNANADLAPFGLTADPADQEDEKQAPTPKSKPAAALPKLTLGSYKDVLKLR